jgi:hypothetical protein
VSEQNPSAAPAGSRFPVGDRVRVVAGTTDPDYPDIPLGGWAGVVREIDETETGPLYLVEWGEETLAVVPAVYRRRCERDDLEFERAWLPAANLQSDPGGPVTVEQPTKLQPRPLNLEDPLDRARQILGLSSDDELPGFSAETVGRFHSHLRKSGRFPFQARLPIGAGPETVTVRKLLPVKTCAEMKSLAAEAVRADEFMVVSLSLLEPLSESAISADLEAYRAWLEETNPPYEPGWLERHPFLRLGLAVVLLSGLVVMLLEALPDTHVPAAVGACVVGVLGGLLGIRYELMFRVVNRLQPNFLGGLLLGVVLGGCVGGGLGALLGTYLGAIPGAIAGTLLAGLLGVLGVPRPSTTALTFVGACVGAAVVAFLSDSEAALSGLWHGLAAGLAAGTVVVVGAMAYVTLLVGRRE